MGNESGITDFEVYTLRRVARVQAAEDTAPGDAIRVQADDRGNVLFQVEPERVPSDKVLQGVDKCLGLANQILAKAASIPASYQVESLVFKLALDQRVGLVFVGEVGVEAGVEIEFKRKRP